MEGLCEHCNEKVSAGLTEALCTAVRRGHVDCGKVLIAAGADVNGRDPDGSTPFSLVGNANQHQCTQMLIEAGADVNLPDGKTHSPLMWAALGGCERSVNMLLQAGADVNYQARNERTALSTASAAGYESCIKILLDAGADVNVPNKAMVSKKYECVKLLIEAGVDANRLYRVKHSLLTVNAAANGDYKVLKLLIESGADVNMRNEKGETPLTAMCFRGSGRSCPDAYIKCLKLLLRTGAKVNFVDSGGFNALCCYISACCDWANEPPNPARVASDKTMVLLLFAAGETLDVINAGAKTKFRGAPLTPKAIPGYLQNDYLKMNLMHICRETIRKLLLNLDPHIHLFDRIPMLGLPSSVTEYLLYGETLDDDIDIDSDDGVGDRDRICEYWNMNMFRAKPAPDVYYHYHPQQ